VFQKFNEFKNYVKRRSEKKLTTSRSYNGTDYTYNEARQRERQAVTHISEEDPKEVKDESNDDKTRTTSRGSI